MNIEKHCPHCKHADWNSRTNPDGTPDLTAAAEMTGNITGECTLHPPVLTRYRKDGDHEWAQPEITIGHRCGHWDVREELR